MTLNFQISLKKASDRNKKKTIFAVDRQTADIPAKSGTHFQLHLG